jgi:hypothetical protein
MQHALKHLEHFLSLGEFWAALVGAAIGGALTAWSALHVQKQAAADQRRRDEGSERRTVEGTLRAVSAELKVLKAETLDDLHKTLKVRAEHRDFAPLEMTSAKQNRVTVFQSNAHMLGRINDDNIREQIVRVYGLIIVFFDYANMMAHDYELWRSLRNQPDENRELLNKLKILESHLQKGTEALQSEIPQLLDRIDKYLSP